METNRINTSVLALTMALGLGGINQANAQSMDYGSLEMLFGEPVTTSATGKPQRATEAPVTMEIVTADDIRRSGATNIPDAIRFVNGMDVIQFSSTDNEVTVRGLNSGNSPNLLVLVNGRQVYLDHYGITVWSAVPVVMDEIRQIEIVKGPNTALFGFNAVAGVINIVTYNPMHDEKGALTVRAGTQHTKEISAMKSFKVNDKLGVRISGEASVQEPFDTDLHPAVTQITPVDSTRESGLIETIYQVTNKTQVGLEGSYARTSRTESRSGLSVGNAEYEIHSARVNALSETDFGLIKGSAYINWLNVDFGPGAILENTVSVAQIEDLFKVGTAHSFRLSAEYRSNTMDSNFDTTATPSQLSTITYNVMSAGAMWDWAIFEKLSMTNSVRLDHMEVEKEGFTPTTPANALFPTPADGLTNESWDRDIDEYSINSGIVFKPNDFDTVRLSYARGVKVPTLLQLNLFTKFAFAPGVDVELIGNPNVEPSIVENYEVGYDRKITKIDGLLRYAAFYQIQDKVPGTTTAIVPVLLAAGPPPVIGANVYKLFENVGQSKLYGAEASLEGRDGNFDWNIGYIWAKLQDDLIPEAALETRESRTPEHRVVGHAGYTWNDWELDAYAQYTSEYSSSVLDIDSFVRVDARIARIINDQITASLTGTNLTGEHLEGASMDVEPKVLLQITAGF